MRFIKYFLFLLVIFPSIANALTAVTYYGVTTCANNGDGTSTSCAASAGAAGAATTLDNALSRARTAHANLVTDDVQITIDMRGSTADTSTPDLTGFTQDATRYIKIQVAQANRHNGQWDTSHYRLVNNGYFAALYIQSKPFWRIDGLQIEQNKTGAGGGTGADGISIATGANNNGVIYITNCIIRYTGDYTNQDALGISNNAVFGSETGLKLVMYNNLVYSFKQNFDIRTNASNNIYLYNNTLIGSASTTIDLQYRLYGSGATLVMKNNLTQTSSSKDYDDGGSSGATFTHNNNLSKDANSPDASYRSKTVTFVGAPDYHLGSSDTNAKDAGADLSGVTEGFSTDIDGQTRTGTWDIGADEIVSSSTAVSSIKMIQ
jgi:hypothetical protein